MKRYVHLCFPLFLLLLTACGGGAAAEEASSETNYLGEVFAPATYAAHLDSAASSGEISAADKDLLLGFIRANSRVIPAERSLQSLLEGAQGDQEMEAEALRLRIKKINITTDRKVYGFHMQLVGYNESAATLARVRGVVDWLDADGNLLKTSPRFSVAGPVAPGDSVDGILLQTAYYRPTGNELNLPEKKAWRDTLKMMEKSAGNLKAERFRFRQQDVALANGLSTDRFWLLSAEERAAQATEVAETEKVIGLKPWCRENTEWLDQLRAGLGEHYLEITPILTNKGEGTHGEYLIFDRIRKVKEFFTTYHKVPGRRINPGPLGGELAYFTEVDFWGWPMELRIFQQDVD